MDNEMKELTATEKLARFEKEKLSRRQALARFGFQAGAAAVAALTADDLLRKVGKEMRNRVGDSKVAQQVAEELSNSGVSFATYPKPTTSVCSCSPHSSTTWWHCEFCTGTSNSYWPALNCVLEGVSTQDCSDCCSRQYDRCMAAYNNPVICGDKLASCDKYICKIASVEESPVSHDRV